MKAISTKYLGVTSTQPTRIKAFDGDNNSVTIRCGFSTMTNDEDQHLAAAVALCTKMGWSTKLIGGGTKQGYVFVFADSELRS